MCLAPLRWSIVYDCIGIEELVEYSSMPPPPRSIVKERQYPFQAASTPPSRAAKGNKEKEVTI